MTNDCERAKRPGRLQAVGTTVLAVVLATLSTSLLLAQGREPVEHSRWPSFRGANASGVADGADLPLEWDAAKGDQVLWKTSISGLGNSSPVVWDGRVYLTTAISSDPNSEFQVSGREGFMGKPADDTSQHAWHVYCLDLRSGNILWDKTAHEGVPKVKRHLKSTHANATPAIDGRNLIVFFASEGLYCYDLDGNLRWKNDLGVIDAGAFDNPDLQWGAASSPILYKNLMIVQCDQKRDSFLAAYEIETGKQVWRVARDEQPSWSTPALFDGNGRAELVTCAPKYSRGYDPLTGDEFWKLGGHSSITVPAPVIGDGLIFLADGYSRPGIRPIYAVRPGAMGDLSLPEDKESTAAVAWSTRRGGPYLPTPILYRNHLYVCNNIGILSCYEASTGQGLYEQRIGGNYSASPIAADGKLYFTSEQGDILVVKAGPQFELLAKNPMGDTCLATPAIAVGSLIVRTQHFAYGIGKAKTGSKDNVILEKSAKKE